MTLYYYDTCDTFVGGAISVSYYYPGAAPKVAASDACKIEHDITPENDEAT